MRALTLLLMAAIIPILHLPTDMPTAPDPVTPLTAPAAPTAPAVVLARPAGAAPSAPTVVLTRPAGGTPAAPVVVLTRPAGGTPAAPVVVLTRPAGSAPAAPVVVMARPSAAAPDAPDEVKALLDPIAPDAPPAVMGPPYRIHPASVTIGTGPSAITYTLAEGVTSACVVYLDADSSDNLISMEGLVITVTPQRKNGMEVTGPLTSNGSTPVVFPALWRTFYDVSSGIYGYSMSPGPHSPNYLAEWMDGPDYWSAWKELTDPTTHTVAEWRSTANVASPDLVPSGAWNAVTNPDAWKPQGSATGTPVFAPVATTAAKIVADLPMYWPDGVLLDATLPPGSDGSGEVTGYETVWLGVEPQ